MQFNQALPLLSRPKYAEGSKLTSKRDDRNNSFLWKKGELNAGQIGSLSQAVQKLSREVAKQRRRIVGGGAAVAPASSGGWNYLGLYNPVTTYNTNDVVSLGTGTAAGMYLSLIAANTNAPDSGIGWVQISTSAGTWL